MIIFIALFFITLGTSLLPFSVKFNSRVLLNFLLSFSGSFLLGITLLHIMPELYENSNSTLQIGIFIMIGFFVQVVLESYSKGIEHGHIHIHDFGKLPYGLFVALTLHALLEGSVLYDANLDNLKVFFGVLVHKLPIAFLLGLLFYTVKIDKKEAFFLLCIFAIATPLGGYFSSFIEYHLMGTSLNVLLMAIATGSFLHVSTTILFETSPEHKLKVNKFLPALLGAVLAVLSSLISH